MAHLEVVRGQSGRDVVVEDKHFGDECISRKLCEDHLQTAFKQSGNEFNPRMHAFASRLAPVSHRKRNVSDPRCNPFDR